jgi:hypothetical protein
MQGRNIVASMGGDVNDPREITKALQSKEASSRFQQAATNRDTRALNRVLSAPAPSFGARGIGEGGTLEQNLDEGARISTDSLMRNMAGRSAAGRLIMQENEKLARFAEMDVAIDAREKKLKDKTLQGIERNILDVQSKALAARSIMRSQLGHLSPAQRNAVLAAQGAVFTEQLNNLETLRKAREGAIDARVKDDRDALETQIRGSEQRIKGLDAAVKIMEQNNADATSIADIRVKLAQEREKLRKKTAGTAVTRKDIVMDALIRNFRTSHAQRSPSGDELKELGRQAEMIVGNKSFDSVIDQSPNMSTAQGPRYGGPDLGSSLSFAGFGIPPSRDELAELQIQESERIKKAAEAKQAQGSAGGGGGILGWFGF